MAGAGVGVAPSLCWEGSRQHPRREAAWWWWRATKSMGGWVGWLRASRTYTVILLGELDNAVQDIQQPLPAGEVAGQLHTHSPGPQGQLAKLHPPSRSCLKL